MSEPIRLWTHAGEMVVMYSPTIAHEAVMSGKLLPCTPVFDVDADMPALDGMPQEDEQPKRKAGRPRKATGGVL